MPGLQVHWFLPTAGDSRDVSGGGISKTVASADSAVRAPDIDYLAQVAKAAEQLGFTAMLTPTGTWCEDAWLTTAALTRETTRLKFLVALRPGALSPTLAAQMAATYQRISGGRLLLNVVTGGDPTEAQRFGDWASHDERYARTDEFLSIVRGAWSGVPYDFTGDALHDCWSPRRGAARPGAADLLRRRVSQPRWTSRPSTPTST